MRGGRFSGILTSSSLWSPRSQASLQRAGGAIQTTPRGRDLCQPSSLSAGGQSFRQWEKAVTPEFTAKKGNFWKAEFVEILKIKGREPKKSRDVKKKEVGWLRRSWGGSGCGSCQGHVKFYEEGRQKRGHMSSFDRNTHTAVPPTCPAAGRHPEGLLA